MIPRPALASVLVGVVVGVLVPLSTRPAGALPAQSPGTTIAVEPARVAPDEVVLVRGQSDCQLMHVALAYRNHGGSMRYGGADGDAEFDAGTSRYHYAIRLRLPRDASPRFDAVVQAQPACGAPEDGFPPSRDVRLQVDPAPARLVVTPLRVRPGRRLTVSGVCLGGSARSVPVRIEWPGGARTDAAPVTDGGFRLSVRLPTRAGAGAGAVVVPATAACPGTALPARVAFTVRLRAGGRATSSPTTTPLPTARSTAYAEPSSTPAGPVEAAPLRRSRSGAPPLLAAGLLAGTLAALAAVATAAARRRNRTPVD